MLSTREKKFKCPIQGCRSTYSQQYSLKQHFAAHHPEQEEKYPHLMPRRSCFLRRKKTEVDRKYICPVPSCACGYEEKKLLKRHFKIKHADKLNDYPDFIAEKRKWQRPGETRAFHCDVPSCTSSYSSVSNLKQHVRVEHPELYSEKFPNHQRRRRSLGSTDYDDYSSDDEVSSWSGHDEEEMESPVQSARKSLANEQMFVEEGDVHLLADFAALQAPALSTQPMEIEMVTEEAEAATQLVMLEQTRLMFADKRNPFTRQEFPPKNNRRHSQ